MQSKRLGKGQIKQVRKSNTLLNLLLSGKGDVKQKFKTQIKEIKARTFNALEITTESTIKSRVKYNIIKFDKKAEGLKPFDQLCKHVQDIEQSMDLNGAITLQINASLLVSFSDRTTDTIHIH